MEWKTILLTVFVVSLCFLAIPIRVEPDTSLQDAKLFEAYVADYKKPYKSDPAEYEKRFGRFQVSLVRLDLGTITMVCCLLLVMSTKDYS